MKVKKRPEVPEAAEMEAAKAADAPSKPKKKDHLGLRLGMLVAKIAMLGLIILVLWTFVGEIHICHTNDMYPALRDGDLVVTLKVGTAHSGEIIVYEHEDALLYGRIVGEAGDEVYIDEDGTLTVNGLAPYENIFYTTKPVEGGMTFPYTIAEGEVFVLADARETGIDSRLLGPVTGKTRGKVVLQLRRRGF